VDLLQLTKSRRENEAANRITISISSVGIQLASSISCWYVQFSQIANARNLNKVWRFDEVGAFNCTIRD